MDPIISGTIGVALAGISAWLTIKDKDGVGWAIAAVLFLLVSCGQLK